MKPFTQKRMTSNYRKYINHLCDLFLVHLFMKFLLIPFHVQCSREYKMFRFWHLIKNLCISLFIIALYCVSVNTNIQHIYSCVQYKYCIIRKTVFESFYSSRRIHRVTFTSLNTAYNNKRSFYFFFLLGKIVDSMNMRKLDAHSLIQ